VKESVQELVEAPEAEVLDGQRGDVAEAGPRAYRRRVSGRITVPVPAEGWCAMPSGRQTRMLKAYMIFSISSPGAWNRSATASSMMTTGAARTTARRIAASTSTGCGMSCTHSNAKAAS
jgi:hypothetical protein